MWSEFRYSLDTYPLLNILWLVVAASWVFAAAGLAWRLARARPVARFDHPGRRLLGALRDSLQQRPIWRRRAAGAMHYALMGGAVLLLSAFVITHYVAPRGLEWRRGDLAHALVDWSLLLALVGLALSAWRRHRRRELPARAEDIGLWVLLLVAVLATLSMSALLVTLARPAWRGAAFFSNALAGLLDALSTPLRRGLYGVSWSVLHAALLGMALLLPWTKWRHIVLAPFSLLTRKQGPLARLDPIDLEGEGPYGALRPRDLTWKERLDVVACTNCDRCTQACPAARAGAEGGYAALSPRALIETLSTAERAAPLAVACGESSLWECTTCLACDEACPVGISPSSFVVDLRRERVLDAAAFPAPLRDLFDHLRRRGNPWGLPRAERDAWLAELDLPVLAPGGRAEVLLWLGCQGGYDAAAREAVRALAALLRSAGVDLAILGADEGCCGDAARRAGNEALWRELALRVVESLAAREIGSIVTLCPHCANALGNEYGALGARLNVMHAAPFLAGLLREGRLPSGEGCCGSAQDDITARKRLRVAFHDPCYLARGLGDVTSARALLAALPGVQPVELSAHGANTLCCGAGGGRMWLDGPGMPSVGAARLDELAAAGVDLCVTACPYCRTMLADGLAERGAEMDVRDLAELLNHVLHSDTSPALPSARGEE